MIMTTSPKRRVVAARYRVQRVLGVCLLVCLGLVPRIPTAETLAQVVAFTPSGTIKGVRQVAVRFSEEMVAFGDPRLPEPFLIECPAAGHVRWVDGRNWVYDFNADLDAGVACDFTLKSDLRTLAGTPFAATPVFHFDTGGPVVRAALPDDGVPDCS